MKKSLIIILTVFSLAFFILSSLFFTRIYENYYYSEIDYHISRMHSTNTHVAQTILSSLSHIASDNTQLTLHDAVTPLLQSGHNLYYMAFIVKPDGTLLAHSNPDERERLQGNIAADEMLYNLQLILHQQDDIGIITEHQYPVVENTVAHTISSRVSNNGDSSVHHNGTLFSLPLTMRNGMIITSHVLFSNQEIYALLNEKNRLFSISNGIITLCTFLFSLALLLLGLIIGGITRDSTRPLPEALIQPEQTHANEGTSTIYKQANQIRAASHNQTRTIMDAIPADRVNNHER